MIKTPFASCKSLSLTTVVFSIFILFSFSAASVAYAEEPNGSATSSNSLANAVVPITVLGTTEFCDGEFRDMTLSSANIAARIQWFRNGIAIPGARSRTYRATQSGTYSAVDTFNAVITSWNDVVLTELAKPIATVTPAGNQTLCVGFGITLTGGFVSGAAYRWINATSGVTLATTQSLFTAQQGNYALIVTNSLGCSDTTDPICVTQAASISTSASTNSICAGSVVNFTSAGNAPFCGTRQISWTVAYQAGSCATSSFNFVNSTNANSNNPQIIFNNPGTYIVTARNTFVNSNGTCATATSQQIINVSAKSSGNVSIPTEACAGSLVAITATPSTCFTGGNVAINWSFPGASPSTASTLDPGPVVYSTPGNYVITYTEVTSCGTTLITRNITVGETPVLNTINNKSICSGSLTAISLSANTPSATTSYSWTVVADAGVTGAGAGSGSTINNLLVNESNVAKNVSYFITPVNNINSVNCTGITRRVIVTVQPSVALNDINDKLICSGSNFTEVFSLENPLPNTTYAFTANAPTGITGATNGNGSSINQTLINTTGSPLSVTYSVIATTNFSGTPCSSLAKTFVVVVNPTTRILNTPAPVCELSNTNIPILSNTPSSNTTYSWNVISVPTGVTGVVNSGVGNTIPLNVGINDTIQSFKMLRYQVVTTSTFNGLTCAGVTDTVELILNPNPVANPIAGMRICSGDSVVISPSANTNASFMEYQWSATFNTSTITGISAGQGKEIRQQVFNSGSSPERVIYSITPIFTNSSLPCEGVAIFDTVWVNPKPVIQNVVSRTICSGSNSNINLESNTEGANPGSTVYFWTVTMPGGVTGGTNSGGFTAVSTIANNLSNSTDQQQNVLYKVVARSTFNGVTCFSDTARFTVVVNPRPTVNPIATQVICSGSLTGINLSSNTIVSQTTFAWTSITSGGITGNTNSSSGGVGASITDVLVNSTITPQFVVYTITPYYTHLGIDCFGPAVTDTVYVLPSINATVASTKTICSGQNVNELITFDTNPSFTSVVWTASAVTGVTGAAAGSGTLVNDVLQTTNNFPSLVTYTITPRYTFRGLTCDGPIKTLTVTVNPVPNYNTVATETRCSGPYRRILLSNTFNNQTTYNVTATSRRGSGGIGPFSSVVEINTTLINSTTILDTIVFSITPVFGNNSVNCTGPTELDTVYLQPNPSASLKRDTICSGATTAVVLTSGLASGISSYSYVVKAANGVVGATSGTAATIQQTLINLTGFPQTVVYEVTPFGTFGAQVCPGSKYDVEILVYPKVTANIVGVNSTRSCAPFSINVVNPLIGANPMPGAVSNYNWYINNVYLGQGVVFPGHIITNADDTAVVKLVVTSIYGCVSDSLSFSFTTPRVSAPAFTTSVSNGCGPLTVSFTNSTSVFAGQTFRWIFGNGQTDVAYSPTPKVYLPHPLGRDTTYTVQLLGITSCDTIITTQSITVRAKPIAAFNANTFQGCSPLTVNFSNASRGNAATYRWDFGNSFSLTSTNINDPISQTYTVTVVDTFVVRLIVDNNCGSDTISYNVIVFPPTVNANLVVDATELNGCAPHTIRIINQSIGTTLHVYNFGDLSPVYTSNKSLDTIFHTYAQPGNYTLNFNASNGCASATSNTPINVYSSPVASFNTTTNRYCEGDPVAFLNNSSGATTYDWDFGDGTGSILSSPIHIFDSAGTFTVRMIAQQFAISGLTCTDTQFAIITIDPQIAPALTVPLDSVYCGISTVTATAQSKGQFITRWKTGDAINNGDFIQFGPNFSHTYTTSGSYTITLIYETINGCLDSVQYPIIINEKPNAQMQASAVYLCERGTVTFNNTSTYTGLFPIRFDYVINGTTITDSTNLTYFFDPTFTTDSFVYDVWLIAYDAIGCADTNKQKVIVKKKAESAMALVSPALGCAPYQPTILNNSLYADFYEWYVDNQLVSTLKNPVITLPDPNTPYVIKLVTYNLADCDRDSSFINVGTQPEILSQVAADDTIGCFGQLFVNFSNTSIGATQHIWDFGDATPLSTAAAPNHLFVNPGLYQVMHIAQSAAGCRDTSYINIKVGKNIQAKYTPSATFGCGTLIVDFVNESQNAVSVKWDFDDGTFAVDPNPQHVFTSRVDPYRVKLFAYNEIGCVDTFIFPTLIQVGTPPVVQFEVDDSLKIIPERTFSFVTLATYPVTFRKWEFGDGNISYEKNPIHEYQFTGKYFVTLTEIDTGGCEETATREVELKDLEGNLWVANAFTPKSGTDKIRSFQPIGYGIEKYRVQVFTSTGKILFESDKLDDQGRPIEGWDGTYKGEEVPQGAYIWSIEAKFLNGTTWKGMPDDKGELKRVGTVILVK